MMSHKTWFTLALRLLGLYLIGTGLPWFFMEMSSWVNLWQMNSQTTTPANAAGLRISTLPGLLSTTGHLSQVALGLYCLLGGRWVINRSLSGAGVSSAE